MCRVGLLDRRPVAEDLGFARDREGDLVFFRIGSGLWERPRFWARGFVIGGGIIPCALDVEGWGAGWGRVMVVSRVGVVKIGVGRRGVDGVCRRGLVCVGEVMGFWEGSVCQSSGTESPPVLVGMQGRLLCLRSWFRRAMKLAWVVSGSSAVWITSWVVRAVCWELGMGREVAAA